MNWPSEVKGSVWIAGDGSGAALLPSALINTCEPPSLDNPGGSLPSGAPGALLT